MVVYRLFSFPGKIRKPKEREAFLRAFNRADPRKTHTWLDPSKDQVVCSKHFVDGAPTECHPHPELFLGSGVEGPSDSAQSRKRRATERTTVKEDEAKRERMADLNMEGPACTPPPSTPPPSTPPSTFSIGTQFIICLLLSLVRKLRAENSSLVKENLDLKSKLLRNTNRRMRSADHQRKIKSEELIINDKYTQFFTGINTASLFTKLHNYIAPFVRRRWRGLKCTVNAVRHFKHSPRKFGPKRKLNSMDEFLLTLMKLRLGLLNRDLAKRFQISPTL